ncbi:hypothetical protein [Methyloglobulus sp.]|nr:hypothetical protein [Methyloglobulus sp.]
MLPSHSRFADGDVFELRRKPYERGNMPRPAQKGILVFEEQETSRI